MSITESTGITSQSEDQNDSMKIPPPNEMFLLNPQCEKSISQEVQFYFKSYQEFITSSNQKLIAVMSALNAANIGHYDDLRIKYPGFILEPPVNMHISQKILTRHKLNGILQRRMLMLFANLSRDLHSTSQEPRLQSLVTTSHVEISLKEE